MGHYLLDTHTAIGFFEGNAAISSTEKQIIKNRDYHKLLSMVLWYLLGN